MSNPTVRITFKLQGDRSFRDLAQDADGLRQIINGCMQETQRLQRRMDWTAIATSAQMASKGIDQLRGALTSCVSEYQGNDVNAKRLEVTMRNSMGATAQQIQMIKDLTNAQQDRGVIAAGAQQQGAQELATYLELSGSLERLIPVLNDTVAQQYGLGASGESVATVATMFGKVLQGQTGALKRYGYTFDENQEKILKYGTESQRVAVLCDVVSASVGGMNEELAKTDSGRQQQLANTLADVRSRIGEMAAAYVPYLDWAAGAGQALTGLTSLIAGFRTVTDAAKSFARQIVITLTAQTRAMMQTIAAQATLTARVIASRGPMLLAAIATGRWSTAQRLLNVILRANPIGLIVTAVGALAGALVYAYKHSESFRAAVDKLWAAVKPLVTMLGEKLVQALTWVAQKLKIVWDYIADLLGLSGSTVDIDVNTNYRQAGLAPWKSEEDKQAGEIEVIDKRLAAEKKADKSGKGSGGKGTPSLKENAVQLADIEGNIQYYQAQLEKATVVEATEINRQIALWQKKADEIKNAGKQVDDTTVTTSIDNNATTLSAIESNIQQYQAQLKTATVTEATEINKQIAMWQRKADEIKNAGLYDENASSVKAYELNISELQQRLETASVTEAAEINREIEMWQHKAEEIKNAGKSYNANASSLKEYEANIDALQKKLETASVTEAALINKEISLWQKKADAIRNAGKAHGDYAGQLTTAWQATKSVTSGITAMAEIGKSGKTAWEQITTAVDGFIQSIQGISQIIKVLQVLGIVTKADATANVQAATAKEANAVASGVAGTQAAAQAAAAAGNVVALEAEANANITDAAAKTFNAHAWLPWVGIGLAAASVALMIATMAGIPMFAEGGVVKGPTLAMVGEYAGASNNPEVIAPLSKLKALIGTPDQGGRWQLLEERIEGTTLVRLFNKTVNKYSRF